MVDETKSDLDDIRYVTILKTILLENITGRYYRQNKEQYQRTIFEANIMVDEYLASGSSKESRFSHNVAMMPSYLLGYLLKMS